MKEKPLFVTMDYYLKTVDYKIRRAEYQKKKNIKAFYNVSPGMLQQIKGANKLSSFEVPRLRTDKQDQVKTMFLMPSFRQYISSSINCMFEAKEKIVENYTLYRKFMDIQITSANYFYNNNSLEKYRMIDGQLQAFKYDRSSTTQRLGVLVDDMKRGMDMEELEDIKPLKDRAPDTENEDVELSHSMSEYSYESENVEITEDEGLPMVKKKSSILDKKSKMDDQKSKNEKKLKKTLTRGKTEYIDEDNEIEESLNMIKH